MTTSIVPIVRIQLCEVLGGPCIKKYVLWFDDKNYAYADSGAEAMAIMVGFFGDEPFDWSAPEGLILEMALIDHESILLAEERGRKLKEKISNQTWN